MHTKDVNRMKLNKKAKKCLMCIDNTNLKTNKVI